MTLAEKVYLHSLARKEAADLVAKYAAEEEEQSIGGLIRGLIKKEYNKDVDFIKSLPGRYDNMKNSVRSKMGELDSYLRYGEAKIKDDFEKHPGLLYKLLKKEYKQGKEDIKPGSAYRERLKKLLSF